MPGDTASTALAAYTVVYRMSPGRMDSDNRERRMTFTFWLAASMLLAMPGVARAGDVVLPSDVAVMLSAAPDTDLMPGQPVDLTLTATNLGIEPVDTLILSSSLFVDEMHVISFNSDECYLVLTVLDGETDFFYLVSWYLAVPDSADSPPLAPGESRSCHFQLSLTSQSPSVFPFSFGLSSLFSDPNPGNDRATVYLRRRGAESTPIPAASSIGLLLLAGLLTLAAYAVSRHRPR